MNQFELSTSISSLSGWEEEEDQLLLLPVEEPTTFAYANKVLSSATQKHYLNDDFADVHFIFESGERVPAHKVLLSTSDVFQTMFNGSWKDEKDVEIVDASADAFKEFLQFFYLDDVKLTMANVAEVMKLGNKYNVTECLNACSKMLIAKLTVENFCSTLDLALLFNRDDVKAKCIAKINFGMLNFLKSSSFLQCDKRILDYILTQDSLNCSEGVLFEAVMSWVCAKTKQNHLTEEIIHAELDDLFYKFRFRSMTFKEFAELIPAYGQIFTKNELQEIIQLIAHGDFEPRLFNVNIRNADLGGGAPDSV